MWFDVIPTELRIWNVGLRKPTPCNGNPLCPVWPFDKVFANRNIKLVTLFCYCLLYYVDIRGKISDGVHLRVDRAKQEGLFPIWNDIIRRSVYPPERLILQSLVFSFSKTTASAVCSEWGCFGIDLCGWVGFRLFEMLIGHCEFAVEWLPLSKEQ